MGMPKGRMSKKELQAFMKAKLAKTKITDSVTTGSSASGPGTKHFTAPSNRNSQAGKPLRNTDLLTRP